MSHLQETCQLLLSGCRWEDVSLPISILRWIRTLARSLNRDVGKDHIGGVRNKVVPLRAVSHVDIRDVSTLETDGAEQDRTQDVDVLGVEIVPDLAVAINGSAAVDVDVLATELEEGGRVLENLVEGVLLPVVGVICELECALDVYNGLWLAIED